MGNGLQCAMCGWNANEVEWDDNQFQESIDDLPLFFAEILLELVKFKSAFGGLKHFSGHPRIIQKVNAKDFQSAYTDFEYIYLTVLGFARLHTHGEEIARKNNGQNFSLNPGVQMLERVCGMTMHGDREGANSLLRTAPISLLAAFQCAKSKRNGFCDFFKGAFKRDADPCLEGRTGRIMEYLEKNGDLQRSTSGSMVPWEEVSLQPLHKMATPCDIVGEHLRVFVNECTWCWACTRGLNYEEAKTKRFDKENVTDFCKLYNAVTFETAMLSRGLVADSKTVQWQVMMDTGYWSPYEDELSAQIEQARQCGASTVQLRIGPEGWKYKIDLKRLVQQNQKTKKERAIRFITVAMPIPQGKISQIDFKAAIHYFVELDTLPAASLETLPILS